MFFTLLPAKKPKSQQMLTKIFLQVDDTLNTPQPWGFVFKSITDWKNDFFWPYWVTRRLERTTFISGNNGYVFIKIFRKNVLGKKSKETLPSPLIKKSTMNFTTYSISITYSIFHIRVVLGYHHAFRLRFQIFSAFYASLFCFGCLSGTRVSFIQISRRWQTTFGFKPKFWTGFGGMERPPSAPLSQTSFFTQRLQPRPYYKNVTEIF